jgi:AraC-like DNA-binding protein
MSSVPLPNFLQLLTQLRRILRVALLGGRVSVDEIAAQMDMSRRTLHRRLAVYGLRFQEVLDETRSGANEERALLGRAGGHWSID